jgi:hypothetical protein
MLRVEEQARQEIIMNQLLNSELARKERTEVNLWIDWLLLFNDTLSTTADTVNHVR